MSAYLSRRCRTVPVATLAMLLAVVMLRGGSPASPCVLAAAQPSAQAKTSPAHLFVITVTDAPKAGVAGKWQVEFPSEPRSFTANLTSTGGKLTGAITMEQRSFDVFDGRRDGNTVTFRVKSPTGNRTVTFKGTASGDSMTFTRDVNIGPGGLPGGEGFFGADGPTQFSAKRVK